METVSTGIQGGSHKMVSKDWLAKATSTGCKVTNVQLVAITGLYCKTIAKVGLTQTWGGTCNLHIGQKFALAIHL